MRPYGGTKVRSGLFIGMPPGPGVDNRSLWIEARLGPDRPPWSVKMELFLAFAFVVLTLALLGLMARQAYTGKHSLLSHPEISSCWA